MCVCVCNIQNTRKACPIHNIPNGQIYAMTPSTEKKIDAYCLCVCACFGYINYGYTDIYIVKERMAPFHLKNFFFLILNLNLNQNQNHYCDRSMVVLQKKTSFHTVDLPYLTTNCNELT